MSSKTQTAVRQVLETIPLAMRTLASELRQTGHTLAPPHFRLLLLLADRPHNLSELAEEQAVSLPTMSSSITTLAQRGWVKRGRVPNDRRMVLIELTPVGRVVLADIQCTVEARVTQLLASLSPADCDRLTAGLELLTAAFAPVGDGGQRDRSTSGLGTEEVEGR
jgi:DNA-binding MarR family transcriptional regulator